MKNNILFLNRLGEPISDRGLQKMLRKYLIRAEIGKATIRTLRHTFGTQHLAKGANPKTIQELMGYKNSRSIFIYQTLAKALITREIGERA